MLAGAPILYCRSGDKSKELANKLADELALQPHPIWGHRTRAIIDGLIADEWHRQG